MLPLEKSLLSICAILLCFVMFLLCATCYFLRVVAEKFANIYKVQT